MRAWLIGPALLTALLAISGCAGLGHRYHPDAPAAASVSVIRHGSEITLTGEVADPGARRALLDAVITSSEDVNVVDRLSARSSTIRSGALTLDFAQSAPVFEAAAAIDDFTARFDGDTVILGGTAGKASEAAAVHDAARDAWPSAVIVDDIAVPPNTAGR